MLIWPWFVTALCLEMERRRILAVWLGVATWSVLLAGHASLMLFSMSLALVVAHVLLSTWVSHRSLWGALALVWIGRILMSVAELLRYWWQDTWQMVDWSLYWQQVLVWFVWDALFVMVGLRCALWLRKRLQPYISLTNRPL